MRLLPEGLNTGQAKLLSFQLLFVIINNVFFLQREKCGFYKRQSLIRGWSCQQKL